MRAILGDDPQHGAVGVDDEGGPSDRQDPRQQATAPGVLAVPCRLPRERCAQLGEPASAHPEQLGNHTVRVREQRIVERALLCEMGLLVDGVGADTHPLGADRGEFIAQVAEMARLGSADRRGRQGEEEQYDRPVGEKRGQRLRPAGVV
jgi:hypothetical protein